jgi:hypothetical protein
MQRNRSINLIALLLALGFAQAILMEPDTDADGIPDKATNRALECSLSCQPGYHCEDPSQGTLIYKTFYEYKPWFTRESADEICAGELPAGLSCSDIHAVISLPEKQMNESDFIIYLPKYGYDSRKPMYWYNRDSGAITQFAVSFQDAMYGNLQATNAEGTGDSSIYWTGSSMNGKYIWSKEGNRTCRGFTDTSGEYTGMVGNPEGINNWLSMTQIPCNETAKILCACKPQAGNGPKCVSDCVPAKEACEAGDCGLQLTGCGASIVCPVECQATNRCRSRFDGYEYDKKCTSCRKCTPGQLLGDIDGYVPSLGFYRHVDWECRQSIDCSDYYFKGFSLSHLSEECYDLEGTYCSQGICAYDLAFNTEFSLDSLKNACAQCREKEDYLRCNEFTGYTIYEHSLSDCSCVLPDGPGVRHEYDLIGETIDGCYVIEHEEAYCCNARSGCDYACISSVDAQGKTPASVAATAGGIDRVCPPEIDPLYGLDAHDTGTI